MPVRILGATLTVISCAFFGFRVSWEYLGRLRFLRQLLDVLDEMENRLSFQCSPLPELVQAAAERGKGEVYRLLKAFADALENHAFADAAGCMRFVLDAENPDTFRRRLLMQLGRSLGRFDLEGQKRELEKLREIVRREILKMEQSQPETLRTWRILGIYGGIALAVLLL